MLRPLFWKEDILQKLSILICSFSILACGELVDASKAVKTMEDEGYSNVTVIERHSISPHWVGGCSGDDSVAFDIRANNSAGKTIKATVCCGFAFKGCTIRH